jgi:hypothetical protein
MRENMISRCFHTAFGGFEIKNLPVSIDAHELCCYILKISTLFNGVPAETFIEVKNGNSQISN